MPEEAGAPESLEFRAEVQQLLNILAHSLYTEREIFLRELISNASDALHRVQFEMLTNRDVLDPEDAELAIHIDFDSEAHTLTVSRQRHRHDARRADREPGDDRTFGRDGLL